MNIRNRPFWSETHTMDSDRELQDEEVAPAQTRCKFRFYQPFLQALAKAGINTILLQARSTKQPANKQTHKAELFKFLIDNFAKQLFHSNRGGVSHQYFSYIQALLHTFVKMKMKVVVYLWWSISVRQLDQLVRIIGCHWTWIPHNLGAKFRTYRQRFSGFRHQVVARWFQTCGKYKLFTPQKEYWPLYVLNQVIQLGRKDQIIFQVQKLLNGMKINSLYLPDAARLQAESHHSADALFNIMAFKELKKSFACFMWQQLMSYWEREPLSFKLLSLL